MKQLLAKSYSRKEHPNQPPDYALLTQHSRDVAEACRALVKVAGQAALINTGLDIALLEHFKLTLLANGWIQDLGKSNSHFQAMVTGQSEIIQLIRHEVVSGLLLLLDESMCDWLMPLGDAKLLAIWGAMGHHRKFDEQTSPKQSLALTVHVTHDDFRIILAEMAQDLNLAAPPIFERDLIIARTSKEECDLGARESLRALMEKFEDNEPEFVEESTRRFLALVKAFGIAADVSASAVAKRGESSSNYSLASFISKELSLGLRSSDLSRLINTWAWDRSSCDPIHRDETVLPPDFVEREFQKNVAASQSHLTIAEAGCGSGKSLAAYLWARKWCERFEAENRTFRLFFCLPTTGTTTEHFKDYALEAGVPASLAHSRSAVDLRTIAETASQEEATSDDASAAQAANDALNAERDKIEALALWSTPLIVTTTDTVLGLMSNARRSIYTMPALMQSAIVFDEIHAFDEYLFGHLLVFIKNFPQLPILLMTASLPEERRRAIEKVRPDLQRVPGPVGFETLPRYIIQHPVDETSAWLAVEKCLKKKGKVLWIRNRVDWANQTYQKAQQYLAVCSVDVYHARLRYKDRSERHRRVIDRFKTEGKAAFLVATQVAEMSLDLSADLLITDIASVPALIQRLGRLNRRATPEEPGEPGVAIVCSLPEVKGDAVAPYKQDELVMTHAWIERLVALGAPINQQNLTEQFAALSGAGKYDYAKAEERACFFGVPHGSGLWRTRPGLTRMEGYTISVIRKCDLNACTEWDRYGEPTRDWLRRYEVAIPIKDAILKWDRVAGIRIAPDDAIIYDYDENTHEGMGARWAGS